MQHTSINSYMYIVHMQMYLGLDRGKDLEREKFIPEFTIFAKLYKLKRYMYMYKISSFIIYKLRSLYLQYTYMYHKNRLFMMFSKTLQ